MRLFDGMDATSMWVMQSWSIRKDIACAVPKGRLLVVDLAGEKWKQDPGVLGAQVPGRTAPQLRRPH